MNEAERARDAKISGMDDFELLELVTAKPRDEAIKFGEFEAFTKMLKDLKAGERAMLSQRQRTWVQGAVRRVLPLNASLVPRGKAVEIPAVLRTLPMHPPGWKAKP